jgi:hypothetical protein
MTLSLPSDLISLIQMFPIYLLVSIGDIPYLPLGSSSENQLLLLFQSQSSSN